MKQRYKTMIGIALLISLLALVVHATQSGFFLTQEDAEIHGADTKVVFIVKDDEGRSVEGANVGVAFYMNGKTGYRVNGLTDTNGVFVAKNKSVGEIIYFIDKDNYYGTHSTFWFDIRNPSAFTDGKWQPYGKELNIVLNPIKKPIKMLGMGYNSEPIYFETNVVSRGFDLLKHDWVKPYGKGEVVDFEVSYNSDGKKFKHYTGATLKIKFVRPFDGGYIIDKNIASDSIKHYCADTNAVYLSSFKFSEYFNPTTKQWRDSVVGKNQSLILQTRSQVDSQGQHTGSLYSILYGPISFGFSRNRFGYMGIRSHISPIFNDTNLEAMNDWDIHTKRKYMDLLEANGVSLVGITNEWFRR